MWGEEAGVSGVMWQLAHGSSGIIEGVVLTCGMPMWIGPAAALVAGIRDRHFLARWWMWVAGYYLVIVGMVAIKWLALLPLLLLLWVMAGMVLAMVMFVSQRRKRLTGACAKCGYDLRAHKAGERCPECGELVPERTV